MENDEPNQIHVQPVTKNKEQGFFKRLRRRFLSIFHSKANRKHTQSDPPVPVDSEISPKLDLSCQSRLSLPDNDETKNGELTSTGVGTEVDGDLNFRPVAKVSVMENDFTAELKKSLMLRSRLVEGGQKSEAITQMEKAKDLNPSISNGEEVQKKVDEKTFEEKLALFESQISGSSLRNSLTKDEKMGDQKTGDTMVKNDAGDHDGASAYVNAEESKEVNDNYDLTANNINGENSNSVKREMYGDNHPEPVSPRDDKSVEKAENESSFDHETTVQENVNEKDGQKDIEFDFVGKRDNINCEQSGGVDVNIDCKTHDENGNENFSKLTENDNENHQYEKRNENNSMDEVEKTENFENI